VGVIVGVVVAIASALVGRALEDRHDLSVTIDEMVVPILESEGQTQRYFGNHVYIRNNGDFTEENVRAVLMVPRDAVVLKGPVMASEPDILVMENRVSKPQEVMGRTHYELLLDRLHPGDWYSMWFIFEGYTELIVVVTSDTDSDQESLPYLRPTDSPFPLASPSMRASPIP
jgi:hypothetical protein